MWLRGPKTYSIFMYLWWDWKRSSCVRIFICFVTTVFPKTRNPWLTLVWLILVNIYKNCLDNECFPQTWKKANIVPIHKKDDKQLKKNYQPVLLLPISSKIFEKIVFNSLFKHLDDNNLWSSNQSGSCPGYSCLHQVLPITNDIYKNFGTNLSLEVRGVFLDLTKHLIEFGMKGQR